MMSRAAGHVAALDLMLRLSPGAWPGQAFQQQAACPAPASDLQLQK